MARIGLLAGAGKLPGIWLKEATARGEEVVAYQISGKAEKDGKAGIKEAAEVLNRLGRSDLSPALRVREINPGNLGGLISWLEEDDIDKIIMLGKIEKTRVFQGENLDPEMQSLLAGLPDFQDETILQALCQRLTGEGFAVLPQTTYLENIFLKPGWLSGPFPKDKSETAGGSGGSDWSFRLRQELEWGLELARQLSDLEIGQSVMVKSGTVLAVEAVEGTDAALERAGRLAGSADPGGSGFFMAKASRPGQDFRIDIPAVGPATIKELNRAGGEALVVEAGRVLVLQQQKFAGLARRFGISVYAAPSQYQEDISSNQSNS